MKLPELLPKRLVKLPRFLVAGGFATLIHWLTMLLLIQFGIAAILATAVGAAVGLLVNYLAQYRYTFSSALPHLVAFPRYLTGAGLGWALNLISFALLSSAGIDVIFAQIIATGLVAVANYLFAERFVFHEEQAADIH